MHALQPDFAAGVVAYLRICHQLVATLAHLHLQVLTTDVAGSLHGAIDQQTVTPRGQIDGNVLNAYRHVVDTAQEY